MRPQKWILISASSFKAFEMNNVDKSGKKKSESGFFPYINQTLFQSSCLNDLLQEYLFSVLLVAGFYHWKNIET